MSQNPVIANLLKYPIALLGLIASLVLGVGLYLQFTELPQLKAAVTEKQKNVEIVRNNQVNSRDFDAHLDQAKQITAEIESRLMDPDETVSNSQQLQRLMELAEVKFVGTIPTPTYFAVEEDVKGNNGIDTKIYAQMEYRLRLTGTLAGVLKFVYLLKTAEHYFVLDSIAITPSIQSEIPDMVMVSMIVRVLSKSVNDA